MVFNEIMGQCANLFRAAKWLLLSLQQILEFLSAANELWLAILEHYFCRAYAGVEAAAHFETIGAGIVEG